MAIKTFHEAPISIFPDVQKVTSGDYALVHLFEENKDYFNMFKQAVKEGREVILDNSIFELGTAFDADKYAKWIKKLKPTWYIVPDALEDANLTLQQFENWVDKYKGKVPGKIIAVAQGKNIGEFINCFTKLHDSEDVDMIAVSFDYSFYIDFADSYAKVDLPTKYHKWAYGRQVILEMLSSFYNLNRFHKPVHLLGCGVPQEAAVYGKSVHYKWIYSIDTSNPVVAGYEGVRYSEGGLEDKSKTKLFTIIDSKVSKEALEDIKYNIEEFKRMWSV